MSPTLVEALAHITYPSLAEQYVFALLKLPIPHTFVTAVLSMMSRWSVGSLAPIYIHLLAAVWSFTHTHSLPSLYAFLQSNMYLRQLKLPIFVFGSVLLF